MCVGSALLLACLCIGIKDFCSSAWAKQNGQVESWNRSHAAPGCMQLGCSFCLRKCRIHSGTIWWLWWFLMVAIYNSIQLCGAWNRQKGARQFEESIGMRRETEHSPSALLNSVLFQGEPHASPHPHRLRSPECGGWSLSGKCYSGSRLEKVGDLAGWICC